MLHAYVTHQIGVTGFDGNSRCQNAPSFVQNEGIRHANDNENDVNNNETGSSKLVLLEWPNTQWS